MKNETLMDKLNKIESIEDKIKYHRNKIAKLENEMSKIMKEIINKKYI